MKNHLDDIFSELTEEVKKYSKRSETEELKEILENITTNEIVSRLINVLPSREKNSYTLDRDVINVIDYIISRLLPQNISVTRSDVVNEMIDLIRLKFNKEYDVINKRQKRKFVEDLNVESCIKYFSITREESTKEEISRFGFNEEFGKSTIRVELTLDNIEFINIFKEINSKYSTSYLLNAILGSMFRKNKVVLK